MPKSRGRATKKIEFTPPPEAKEVKQNPRWWVPVMCALLILGLVWIVVTYLAQGRFPIPGLHNWNLAIGFGIMLAGGAMSLGWK